MMTWVQSLGPIRWKREPIPARSSDFHMCIMIYLHTYTQTQTKTSQITPKAVLLTQYSYALAHTCICIIHTYTHSHTHTKMCIFTFLKPTQADGGVEVRSGHAERWSVTSSWNCRVCSSIEDWVDFTGLLWKENSCSPPRRYTVPFTTKRNKKNSPQWSISFFFLSFLTPPKEILISQCVGNQLATVPCSGRL